MNFIALINVFWIIVAVVLYMKHSCTSCKRSSIFARMHLLKTKIETTVTFPDNLNEYTYLALNRLNVGLLMHSLFYSPNLIEYIALNRMAKKEVQLYRLGECGGKEIKSCIVILCSLQAIVFYNISICGINAAIIPDASLEFPTTTLDMFGRTKILYELCDKHHLLAKDIFSTDAYAYLCKIGIAVGVIEHIPNIPNIDQYIVY